LALVAGLYKLEGDFVKDQDKNQEAVLDNQRLLSFHLEFSLSGNSRGAYDIEGKIDELYL
jgi:hypothetical protein